MILDRIMQGHKLYTFLLSMAYLFNTRRHLLLATAIHDDSALGTQSFGGTNGIHSRIAATHYDHRFGTE